MRNLLRLAWKVFSLLGAVLSLRRWWRTLTDPEEKREVRLLAGAIIVGMAALLVISLATGFSAPARVAVGEAPAVTQIVVDFADTVPLATIDRIERGYGVDFVPNSVHAVDDRLMIADVSRLSARSRAALLARLNADPRVEAAGPNLWFKLQGEAVPATQSPVAGAQMTPNDPRYGEQWGFQMIGMPAAWEKATGKGVVVAVIDTGCAYEKMKDVPAASDLKGKYVDAYDFITNSKKAYDDHGHGTHVAGTIAQSTNNKHGVAGIAYEATIMPLKVLTGKGYGSLSDIADAIKYAADHGANVINMSLGGPTGHPVLRKAVTYAHQKGVTIVCAAGNGMGEGVGYPAAYPECIAVSSVGPSGELAWYSSYGKEVALAAPGGEYRSEAERGGGVLQNTVYDKKDTFEFWQGTSMASPHVAGVAALIYESGIKTPEAIRNRLRSTATPKGDELRYGAGVLNAAAAVGASEAGWLIASAARPVDCGGACGLAAWLMLCGGFAIGYSLGRLGLLALTRRVR